MSDRRLTHLPAALRPWAAYLYGLPLDMALALQPLAARIHALLDRAAPQPRGGGHDPDGYAGISNHGSVDRLLISEWLIAEAFPDEFLRRAATGEQVFLSLAHRNPHAVQNVTALFDVGPWQLGSPRIAHLALLVALSRRAASREATLRIGVLQNPAAGLRQGASMRTLRGLLEARSGAPVEQGHVERWQGLQTLRSSERDEVWLIAPERWVAEKLNGSQITVSQPPQPHRRALQLCVRPRMRRAHSIELSLPAPDAAVRLLRDPYSVTPAKKGPSKHSFDPTRHAFDTTKGFGFAADGRRLIVATPDGGAIAFHVPDSPRATPGKPRRFTPPPGSSLVAFGTFKRRRIAVLRDARGLLVLGSQVRPTGLRLREPLGQPFEKRYPPFGMRGSLAVAAEFRDQHGDLYLDLRGASPAWRHLALEKTRDPGLAGSSLQSAMVIGTKRAELEVGYKAGPEGPCWIRAELGTRRREFELDHPPHDARIGHGSPFTAAFEQRDGIWQITNYASNWKVWHPLPLTRVIHVTELDGQPAFVLFLCTQPHERLLVANHRETFELPPLAGPLRSVTCSPTAPVIAYGSGPAELRVYSLSRRQTLLHLVT